MQKQFTTFIEQKPLIVLGLILLLFVVLAGPLFLGVEANVSQDGYWYMALGKNLFEHGKYSLYSQIEHQKYPPGFPVLIGLFEIGTHDYLLAARLVSFVCALLTIGVVYLFGRKFGTGTGLLSAFFAATFFLLVDYAVFGMSEMSFVLFTLLGAYLVIGNNRETTVEKILYLLGYALIAYSALIRYTGFVTLAAALGTEIFEFMRAKNDITSFFKHKKNWFIIVGLFVFFVVLSPWLIRNLLTFQSLFGNAYASEQYSPFNPNFLTNILQLGALPLLLTLIGVYWYVTKKVKNTFAQFILIDTILVIVFYYWWGYAMTRFLTALVLLVTIFPALTITHMYTTHKKILLPLVLVLGLLVTQLYAFETVDGNYYANSFSLKNVVSATTWAKKEVPVSALLMVPDIPIYNYYLERNDLENITNYSQLKNPAVLMTPELYIIADEQHPWVSNAVLKNDLNTLTTDTEYKGRKIRIVRKYSEVQAFPQLTKTTPFFANSYSSGMVKVFKAQEPQILQID